MEPNESPLWSSDKSENTAGLWFSRNLSAPRYHHFMKMIFQFPVKDSFPRFSIGIEITDFELRRLFFCIKPEFFNGFTAISRIPVPPYSFNGVFPAELHPEKDPHHPCSKTEIEPPGKLLAPPGLITGDLWQRHNISFPLRCQTNFARSIRDRKHFSWFRRSGIERENIIPSILNFNGRPPMTTDDVFPLRVIARTCFP